MLTAAACGSSPAATPSRLEMRPGARTRARGAALLELPTQPPPNNQTHHSRGAGSAADIVD